MSFLHPEYLWLAPLLALPVVIHLLNRVRYKRVRWAAMEFLLAGERRAVRRAQLRQWLLMALRILILTAALGALVQPVLSGSLALLLGGSEHVVVLLDNSASMAGGDAGGSAFDVAKQSATSTIQSLPRTASVSVASLAGRYDSPFAQPVQDHQAALTALQSISLTDGSTNIPEALAAASANLSHPGTGGGGGTGGTLWLLTDLRKENWKVSDSGAWDKVRTALHAAGGPRLLITDLAPNVEQNFAVTDLRLEPTVLSVGDRPRLTATVTLFGKAPGATSIRLSIDDKPVDNQPLNFDAPGSREVTFHLPAVTSGSHAGKVELQRDGLPADDRASFLLRPSPRMKVLVVESAGATDPALSPGYFLRLALSPAPSPSTSGNVSSGMPPGDSSGGDAAAVSPFAPTSATPDKLAQLTLSDFTAVFLVEPPPLDGPALDALRRYVNDGGLAILFPGNRTSPQTWNSAAFPPAKLEAPVDLPDEKRLRVTSVATNSSITTSLPSEGLDRVLVARYFPMSIEGGGEVLATLEDGKPLLARWQMGKGRVYLFAVSAQADYSSLPLTPVLLLTTHRMLQTHISEVGDPVCQSVFTRLWLPSDRGHVILPDGSQKTILRDSEASGRPFFDQTSQAGIYRFLPEGAASEKAVPVAALNVPAEESSLEKIEAQEIRALLPGTSVVVARGGQSDSLPEAGAAKAPGSAGFPLALLAALALAGEVVMAWSMGQPARGGTAIA